MLGVPQLVCLDTNVLLRAFVDEHEAQNVVARDLLRSFNSERRGFVTNIALTEMYWVLGSSYHQPKHACLTLIRHLLTIPALEFEDSEGVEQALTLADEGADFADALIHATAMQFMTDHTVTFDRRAAKYLGWNLLDERVAEDEVAERNAHVSLEDDEREMRARNRTQ